MTRLIGFTTRSRNLIGCDDCDLSLAALGKVGPRTPSTEAWVGSYQEPSVSPLLPSCLILPTSPSLRGEELTDGVSTGVLTALVAYCIIKLEGFLFDSKNGLCLTNIFVNENQCKDWEPWRTVFGTEESATAGGFGTIAWWTDFAMYTGIAVSCLHFAQHCRKGRTADKTMITMTTTAFAGRHSGHSHSLSDGIHSIRDGG